MANDSKNMRIESPPVATEPDAVKSETDLLTIEVKKEQHLTSTELEVGKRLFIKWGSWFLVFFCIPIFCFLIVNFVMDIYQDKEALGAFLARAWDVLVSIVIGVLLGRNDRWFK